MERDRDAKDKPKRTERLKNREKKKSNSATEKERKRAHLRETEELKSIDIFYRRGRHNGKPRDTERP